MMTRGWGKTTSARGEASRELGNTIRERGNASDELGSARREALSTSVEPRTPSRVVRRPSRDDGRAASGPQTRRRVGAGTLGCRQRDARGTSDVAVSPPSALNNPHADAR